MNNLAFIKRNDVFTDSWIIAQNIAREHASVTYNIKKYKERFAAMGPIYSSPTRISQKGRPAEVFDLNEAQAIFLMTLMDNNDIVLDFKMKLAMEFVRMRSLLLQKQTRDWQHARLHSKQVRLQETDAIKALVEYARQQGSQHADKLYVVYSKLVKQMAEYGTRDAADVAALTMIIAFESILFGVITTEMQLNTYYKDIYQKAKAQLNEMKRLWAAPRLTA